MTQVSNDFEAGADGANLTTDTAPDAFDAIVVSANPHVAAFDDVAAMHGSLGARFKANDAGNASFAYGEYTTSIGTLSGLHYGRVYGRVATLPTNSRRFMQVINGSAFGFELLVNAAGTLLVTRAETGATLWTSSVGLLAGAVDFRIEYAIDHGFGGGNDTLTVDVYLDANVDGTTPDESSGELNANFASSATIFRYGCINNTFDVWEIHLDDVVVGATSPVGPAGSGPGTIDAGKATETATLAGADLTGTGSVAVDAGSRAAASDVPGADVAATGAVPIDSGARAAATAIPGADLSVTGSAPLDAGAVAASTDVPGADVAASGATLDAGAVAAATDVPGVDLTGAGTASLDAGARAGATDVPGADLQSGASTISAGRATSTATLAGADLAPTGTATLDAGARTAVTAVYGADPVASGVVAIDAGSALATATVHGADVGVSVLVQMSLAAVAQNGLTLTATPIRNLTLGAGHRHGLDLEAAIT